MLFVFNDVECILGDVSEGILCNVDEIEVAFHVSGHVARVACQFLPDVLLECCPTPPAHLLDLRVRVPGERQRVHAPTAERMHVDPCDWDPLGCRVLQFRCRQFECPADILSCDVRLCSCRPVQ